MSPMLVENGLGVEEILDTVERVLHDDLNDAISEVYERRAASDEARALMRGKPYEEIEFDAVDPDHFYVGNFPSLVLEEVPQEKYPYVVLTIEDYAPDAEDARTDQVNVIRDALVIHALARASDEEGSEIVFRRAVRMGEAIYIALQSNPATKSMLRGVSNPVRGQHSVPWTYQHKGRGKDWWFQAVGTTYAVKTFTTDY